MSYTSDIWPCGAPTICLNKALLMLQSYNSEFWHFSGHTHVIRRLHKGRYTVSKLGLHSSGK